MGSLHFRVRNPIKYPAHLENAQKKWVGDPKIYRHYLNEELLSHKNAGHIDRLRAIHRINAKAS